jgi:hypothetical protein
VVRHVILNDPVAMTGKKKNEMHTHAEMQRQEKSLKNNTQNFSKH